MDNYDIENDKKIKELASDIMQLSRNAILVNLRFLDWPINELGLKNNCKIDTLACDGNDLYYNPKYILLSYREEIELPIHNYLHFLLHCIFRHMYVNTLIEKEYWDLACDIAVENTLIELNFSNASIKNFGLEMECIKKFKNNNIKITAEKLYAHFLDSNISAQDLSKLKDTFSFDNHFLWYMSNNDKQNLLNSDDSSNSAPNKQVLLNSNNLSNSASNKQNVNSNANVQSLTSLNDSSMLDGMANGKQQRWKEISERMQEEIISFTSNKQQGFASGDLIQNLREVNREKYDYASFLKKFAVMGEAMQINDDEFDYIFYTYGLKIYKNLPLIEPLEYKDVKKIREFVIAIDTSGSVIGEEVESFLNKTYNILMSEESFFKKINVHIIQCDTEIKEDKVIHSKDEFEEYIKTMKLRGFGGTDFRPVFDYVNKLIENKIFINLKGMIYFTDGYGTFPEKQPNYQTAFVFVNDDYEIPEVPSWAIKLKLERSDLKEDRLNEY